MEKKNVIVLGIKSELEKIRENPQRFISEQEAIITYCKDVDSFNTLVKEINPSAVYYTGKIRQHIEPYGWAMTANDSERIGKYIKSKGIEKVVKLKVN